MISYQWDVQQEVIKFRQRLHEAGYRVWIDIEQMHMGKIATNSIAIIVFNNVN